VGPAAVWEADPAGGVVPDQSLPVGFVEGAAQGGPDVLQGGGGDQPPARGAAGGQPAEHALHLRGVQFAEPDVSELRDEEPVHVGAVGAQRGRGQPVGGFVQPVLQPPADRPHLPRGTGVRQGE